MTLITYGVWSNLIEIAFSRGIAAWASRSLYMTYGLTARWVLGQQVDPPRMRKLMTYRGPTRLRTGVLSLWHHKVLVLALDLEHGRVTDNGHQGSWAATDKILDEAQRVLRDKRLLPDWIPQDWHLWTSVGRPRRGRPTTGRRKMARDVMLEAFRERVPWTRETPGAGDERCRWFSWRACRQHLPLLEAFETSKRVLATGRNRRYLTYRWLPHSNTAPLPEYWACGFINQRARREWRRRPREKERGDMPTYLEKYEEELDRLINEGGSQEAVDNHVRQLNAFHPSDFATWLARASLVCGECSEAATTIAVTPESPVACERHR